MTILLAGDIGGTKTILRLVQAEARSDQPEAALESLHEVRYVSKAFPDLVPMVEMFLEDAYKAIGQELKPEKACFAIAGPVVNNTSNVTNVGWTLSADRLSQSLSIPTVKLINDFAAVGYGVLGLGESDLHLLQEGKRDPAAPIGIIGAGTGLGQGFLIKIGDTYEVFGSEGGHADFAPKTELEFQLARYLLDKHHIERVSVERVVSGQGVVSIYQFLRDRDFAAESSDVAEVVRTWESEAGREKTVDPAAAISKAAAEKRDQLSMKTMQMFVEAYGAEAGNLALKLLPFGGIYIAGGIAAKNLELMTEGKFLYAFGHKGRMSEIVERIPVHVVLNPQVGLIGAALCASRL